MFFNRDRAQPEPPPAPGDDLPALRAELAALEGEAPELLRRISESNMTIGAEADSREAAERLAHVRRRIAGLRDRIAAAEAVARLAEIAAMRRECEGLLMQWGRFIAEDYPTAATAIAAGCGSGSGRMCCGSRSPCGCRRCRPRCASASRRPRRPPRCPSPRRARRTCLRGWAGLRPWCGYRTRPGGPRTISGRPRPVPADEPARASPLAAARGGA